jgi:hydrogenase maturation protein HypF
MNASPLAAALGAAAPLGGASGGVRSRLRIEIRGAVQGVGFRPFVYRLAREERLAGWVLNDARGVELEVEGDAARIERFCRRLSDERPDPAVVQSLAATELPPSGEAGFRIVASAGADVKIAVILPDLATCDRLPARDLRARRPAHGYPFTNCTSCGPRFTILRGSPLRPAEHDDARLHHVPRLPAEYEDPRDRRFHAQPNACPACGPRLALRDRRGALLARARSGARGAGEGARGGAGSWR